MENLKIRVTTKQESKEAQELFFDLGYGWHGKGKVVSYSDKILSDYFGWLVLWKPSYLTKTVIQMGGGFEDCKEITLPQLRDMVVLKRNDKSDKNVVDAKYPDANLYLDSSNKLFVFHIPTQTWKESNLNGEEEVMQSLKPIEKEMKEQPMKEYLDKDYVLRQVKQTSGDNHVPSDWIEVPKGAEILIAILGDEVFYKSGEPWEWHCEASKKWKKCSDIVGLDGFQDILWHRKKESLNDKVASAEVARQDNVNHPSHYNKGGIECIDAIQAGMSEEMFEGYLKGCCNKYLWRYKMKGGSESLRKAEWYLKRLIKLNEEIESRN